MFASTAVKVAIAVAVVVALVAIVAAILLARQKRRRKELQSRFGPEYERTVEGAGDRKKAEAELAERMERRDALDVQPLDPEARASYSADWERVQQGFVDEPSRSVQEADVLVNRVMRDRGYPVEDFDAQADLISVDHPDLVDNYRSAREIHRASVARTASTEDLRKALVHYRSLFGELLGADGPSGPEIGGSGTVAPPPPPPDR